VRNRALSAARLAAGLLAGVCGASVSAAEDTMPQIGKTYLFDYGQVVIRVQYLSDHTLAWEQVKGPEAGSKGEEQYSFAAIRPAVYFIWWQEKDSSVVSQVVDFEQAVVHTTWVSPDKKLAAFRGRIRSQP
jgi:hypothetical protein